MNRCYIDFADRTISREVLSISLANWFFIAISIFFFIFCVEKMYRDINEIINTTTKLEKIRLQKAKVLAIKPQNLIPNAKIEAINLPIKQLNFPWSDLFDALENATTPAVALIEIDSDASKGVLKIQAEAASSNEMIMFVENIKRETIFFDTYITKHEISDLAPQKPLRFSVETKWRKEIK